MQHLDAVLEIYHLSIIFPHVYEQKQMIVSCLCYDIRSKSLCHVLLLVCNTGHQNYGWHVILHATTCNSETCETDGYLKVSEIQYLLNIYLKSCSIPLNNWRSWRVVLERKSKFKKNIKWRHTAHPVLSKSPEALRSQNEASLST